MNVTDFLSIHFNTNTTLLWYATSSSFFNSAYWTASGSFFSFSWSLPATCIPCCFRRGDSSSELH
jgi:hypothetical protein